MSTIQINNSRIGYTDEGQGNALVLLHGFTESRAIWDDFVGRLKNSFRVIAVDLPGHGESDSLGDIHTMEEMAAVLKAVLDHLSVGRCVVIGHSMGGYTALAFASVWPEMVAGLGLFHSTAAADSEEARQARDKAIAVIRQDRKGFLFQFIPSLFASDNRERLKPLIDSLVEAASGMTAQSIIAAQEGMKLRHDGRQVIGEANFPVLFIAGKQDVRIPIEGILPQIALPRRSYSLILDDVGHMGWAEAPEATMAMIRMFVQACA